MENERRDEQWKSDEKNPAGPSPRSESKSCLQTLSSPPAGRALARRRNATALLAEADFFGRRRAVAGRRCEQQRKPRANRAASKIPRRIAEQPRRERFGVFTSETRDDELIESETRPSEEATGSRSPSSSPAWRRTARAMARGSPHHRADCTRRGCRWYCRRRHTPPGKRRPGLCASSSRNGPYHRGTSIGAQPLWPRSPADPKN